MSSSSPFLSTLDPPIYRHRPLVAPPVSSPLSPSPYLQVPLAAFAFFSAPTHAARGEFCGLAAGSAVSPPFASPWRSRRPPASWLPFLGLSRSRMLARSRLKDTSRWRPFSSAVSGSGTAWRGPSTGWRSGAWVWVPNWQRLGHHARPAFIGASRPS
jgi:hypothetical protein